MNLEISFYMVAKIAININVESVETPNTLNVVICELVNSMYDSFNKQRANCIYWRSLVSQCVFVYVLATFFHRNIYRWNKFFHFIHHITSYLNLARLGSVWLVSFTLHVHYKISKDGLLHLFWFTIWSGRFFLKSSFIFLILSILFVSVKFQSVNT